MPDSMRYRLTDTVGDTGTNREVLMDRLHDRLSDTLPDERYRALLVDMALLNLKETLDAHEEWQGDPEVAKAFSTKVVRPKYRTWTETKRP